MVNPSLTLDLAPLRTLSGGDSLFMQEVLGMILTQSPSMQERMEALLAEQDLQELSRAAHKYKSSLQILGNAEIIDMVQRIEHLAAAGTFTPKLQELIEDFDMVTEQLLDIIQEELLLLSTSE